MKLYLADHAITRYQERVKPALIRRQAQAELEVLLRAAGEVGPRPDWLPPGQPPSDGYIELADGIVGAVLNNLVTTVLVRASSSPKHRAARKTTRQARRRSKHGRAKHSYGPGSKGYKRDSRRGFEDEAA